MKIVHSTFRLVDDSYPHRTFCNLCGTKVFTMRCYAEHSYATVYCPSVRLSLCV